MFYRDVRGSSHHATSQEEATGVSWRQTVDNSLILLSDSSYCLILMFLIFRTKIFSHMIHSQKLE